MQVMHTHSIMTNIAIRPALPEDAAHIAHFLEVQWGATVMVSRGRLFDVTRLPAFIAIWDGLLVGLITYHIENGECEIVTLDSIVSNMGVGTALIEAVRQAAEHCWRLWLITTNDNLYALGFYQKRGFQLVAVHRNAIELSRQMKPEIPLIGMDGIPIRDEIELEILL